MALRESRIITVGGKPVSHIRIAYNWLSIYGMRIKAASLGGVCTDPEHRGRGIGRALLLHLAQLANARGCGRMEWAVLDWNQPAIDFYEALGARRLRDWQICRLTGEALARHA